MSRAVEGRKNARRSFREAFHELRRAYQREDAGTVLAAFDEARATSLGFRFITGALERFYPVRAFLSVASEVFDPALGALGLHQGCRELLDAASVEWEAALSDEHAETLRTAPVLFCSNHPSLLTPFLVAATIEREDLRFLSTNYVRRLLPNLQPYSFAFEVPLTRSWTEWRRGGLRRVLVYRLLSLLHRVPPPEAAKEVNRRGLEDGIAHLVEGGSVLIAPGGGGKRDRRWFSGIGILVCQALESAGADPIYLVPVLEENCTNQRIYAHLMRGPIARAKRALMHRRPVRITFGTPKPLGEIIAPGATTQEAVDAARSYYDRQFPGS